MVRLIDVAHLLNGSDQPTDPRMPRRGAPAMLKVSTSYRASGGCGANSGPPASLAAFRLVRQHRRRLKKCGGVVRSAPSHKQDASRARAQVEAFAADRGMQIASRYVENGSGAKLARPSCARRALYGPAVRPKRPSPGSLSAGRRMSKPRTAPKKFSSKPSTQPTVIPT
jgi:hypothetical protein